MHGRMRQTNRMAIPVKDHKLRFNPENQLEELRQLDTSCSLDKMYFCACSLRFLIWRECCLYKVEISCSKAETKHHYNVFINVIPSLGNGVTHIQ